MRNLFCRSLSALLAIVSINTLNSSLMAWEGDCCDAPAPECDRFYIGAFGGGIYSNSTKMSQMGTAFFTEAAGGPLSIYARGSTKKTCSGFVGGQIGYEWSRPNIGCSDWSIAPALELEAYWYNHKKKGHLLNDNNPERLPEHDFDNSFHVDSTVVLGNVVISLKNSACYAGFAPYIGGGIGAAHLSLNHANSLQVSPPEAGINHFNSKRSDTSWAFAAQAKVGLQYTICESFRIFGEYRYLFIDSSNYIFGSTVYPDHAPTSPWNVKMKNIHYNAFAVGIRYDLY